MQKEKNKAPAEPMVFLTVTQYQALLDSHKRETRGLQEVIIRLQEENKLLKYWQWGRRSEKGLPQDPGQLCLWDTTEDSVEVKAVEKKAQKEEEKYNRFRKRFKEEKPSPHSRKPLPESLPRESVTLEPEGVDLRGAIRIGQEVTERLEIRPAELFVSQVIRPKYKLATGEIAIAGLPVQALSRSNAGSSMLAHLAVSKYVDHLPLHRQIEMFLRDQMKLSPSTMSNWMMAAAQELEPVYNEMRESMRKCRYVIADETTYKVLESSRKGVLHQGYMWAFYIPQYHTPYFEYHPGRGDQALSVLFNCSIRAVQSDGYPAYDIFDRLKGYVHLNCWAHARRKFKEAALSDPVRAKTILKMIGKLYGYESEIRGKGLEGAEKVSFRQEHAYPVLKAIEEWLVQNGEKVKEKSLMGDAIKYTLKRMTQLSVYVTDAEYQIDSNAVERSIRPLTLNRKNALFCGSHDAAHTAAIYFTLFGCCYQHGVNPQKWMQDVLIRVKTCDPKDYSSLLPFNWKKKPEATNTLPILEEEPTAQLQQ